MRPAHFDDQHRAARQAWLAGLSAAPQKAGALSAAGAALVAVAIGAIAADWATGEVIATQLASLLAGSL
jgi:hypothetical protein